MGNLMSMFGLIFFAAGVYSIYAWYKMKITGEINTTLLLGKGIDPKRCKDTPGYLKKAKPVVLIFGIVATVYGAIDTLSNLVWPDNELLYIIDIVLMVLFLAALVFFMVFTSRLRKEFF